MVKLKEKSLRDRGQSKKKQKLEHGQNPKVLGDDLDDFELEVEDFRDEDTAEVEGEIVNLPSNAEDISEPVSKQEQTHTKQEGAVQAAKPKKRKKGKPKGDDRSVEVAESSLAEQVDWLWQSFSSSTGASPLERAGLEESCMAAWDGSVSLEQQLLTFEPSWRNLMLSRNCPDRGAPVVLIIAASAVQANNLAKLLPTINKGCKVAKLFAKHFKVEEQKLMLKEPVSVATGTPNRLNKLAEEKALSFQRLGLVNLDVAKDAKQRTLLDIPEVCNDLWKFIKDHISERLEQGSTQIALIDSTKSQ